MEEIKTNINQKSRMNRTFVNNNYSNPRTVSNEPIDNPSHSILVQSVVSSDKKGTNLKGHPSNHSY